MTFEELMQDQHREGTEGKISGKAEAVLELLQDLGLV